MSHEIDRMIQGCHSQADSRDVLHKLLARIRENEGKIQELVSEADILKSFLSGFITGLEGRIEALESQ